MAGGVQDFCIAEPAEAGVHISKDMILFAEVQKFWNREPVATHAAGIRRAVNLKIDKVAGVLIGKGVDQNSIDCAEDDGGRADT
jgi:hypothetical protein